MDTTMLKSSIDLWKKRRELSKKSEKALWGGIFLALIFFIFTSCTNAFAGTWTSTSGITTYVKFYGDPIPSGGIIRVWIQSGSRYDITNNGGIVTDTHHTSLCPYYGYVDITAGSTYKLITINDSNRWVDSAVLINLVGTSDYASWSDWNIPGRMIGMVTCHWNVSTLHSHNSSGVEYKSTGNTSTHTKYTYCTGHGTDHSQNKVGTSESHVDANNDGVCDKCNQVYRNRYYLDLNGILNEQTVYNITGYGTADVYVAGRGTSQGVSDYWQYTAQGTAYSISPKANSGYTYLGVASGDISGTMPNSEMSVYLKFGSNYTIKFEGNGADGGSTASESRVYSDDAKELTANGFYKNKYLFGGWNTSADGSGTGYSDKQSVNNLTDTVNGTVTLYAQWSDAPGYHNGQPIVYTITYNLFPQNGNGTKITDPGNPTTYTVETPTFTLKNPSATGYDFEGWYGSGTNGSKGVPIVQGSIGDLHFTADWLPTKDTSKSFSKDQNISYVKTTDITENKVQFWQFMPPR